MTTKIKDDIAVFAKIMSDLLRLSHTLKGVDYRAVKECIIAIDEARDVLLASNLLTTMERLKRDSK